MEPTTPIPSAEGPALESLKSKINDSSLPTLDLARALKQHLDTYPQSQRAFTNKLGMKNMLSRFAEHLVLLKLPADQTQALEGKILSRTEVQKLGEFVPGNKREEQAGTEQEHDQEQQEQTGTGEEQAGTAQEQAQEHQINGKEHVYLPKERLNSFNEGFPLLRDTINTVSRLVFFWAKDASLGDLAERWALKFRSTGWLKTAFALAAILLAGYGGWTAARDVLRTVRGYGGNGVTALNGLTPTLPYSHTPKLTGSRWVSGRRLEMRWQPVAQSALYRIYWHSRDGRDIQPLGDVTTPGALVNVAYTPLRRGGAVSVTAISAQDEESAHSPLIAFEPTPVNQQDQVEPLPLVADAVTRRVGDAETRPLSGAVSPLPRVTPSPRLSTPAPPPTEIHAEIKTPDLILLSWRAVGNSVRYNVYSSGSRDLSALRKENAQPLKANRVEWTPETGLPRYWVVVTTLDETGHESAYSEAIEVVRNPEKSDAASDAAAGILKKIIPW